MTHPAPSTAGPGLPTFDLLASYGWSPARSEAFHAAAPPGCEPGRIVAATRGLVLARTSSGECWGVPTGRLRERLQKAGLSLCAGDWIILQPNPGPSKASIIDLLPRSASLMRQGPGIGGRPQCLAANLEVALLVMGLDRNFNPARMERLLAMAWGSGAGPVVVLTKRDLNAQWEAFAARITQEVRALDGRGRHTTSLRELFLLPGGGCLIDTPGIREVGLHAEGSDLDSAFSDIAALAGGCRFRDCTHGAEPGCAVQVALAEGSIDPDRYGRYLRLRREVAFEAARNDERLWREREEKWRRISKLQKHFKNR